MSQDYTVAKELASLKEIKQSAEQRISDLSLNALNYVNDHRLHKADGGGGSLDNPYDLIIEDVDGDLSTFRIAKHPEDWDPVNLTNLSPALRLDGLYYPMTWLTSTIGALVAFINEPVSSKIRCEAVKLRLESKVVEPTSWDMMDVTFVSNTVLSENDTQHQ